MCGFRSDEAELTYLKEYLALREARLPEGSKAWYRERIAVLEASIARKAGKCTNCTKTPELATA